MVKNSLKIGVIGTGYWGKHYIRLLKTLPCELVGLADIDQEKKELASENQIAFFQDYRKLLRHVEAVAIVTPPSTHYHIASEAVKRGKHILVEKPLTLKVSDARKLEKLAVKNNVTVMAGHTYLYHPAISYFKKLLDKVELGKIYYLILSWFNLGIVRHDVNALWNFAPHPFSLLFYLLGQTPASVQSAGGKFLGGKTEDAVFNNLIYENGMIAQVNLSWLHPVKLREIVAVGSKKMINFNDVKIDAPLTIIDKGISPEEFNRFQNWNTYAEFISKTRYGDIGIPKFEKEEPLKIQLEDFLKCCLGNLRPKADIRSALSTLAVLEAATKSLESGGKVVRI